MRYKTKMRILGALMGLLGLGLGMYWYDWKLILVIFIMIYGNNIERSSNNQFTINGDDLKKNIMDINFKDTFTK